MKMLLLVSLLLSPAAFAAPAPAPVIFFEIYVSNVAKAKAFYGDLLGWQFTPTPGFTTMWKIVAPTGGTEGALIQKDGRVNDAWGTIVYAHVDKIRDVSDLALKLGATVEAPIGVIPGVGSITLLRDPDHNIFGLISDEGK